MKKYEGIKPSKGVEMFALFDMSVWITGKKGKWIDFKMISDKPRVKANWYLKHNGERFSNNKDYKTLKDYDPAIEKRLSEILIDSFYLCEIEADNLK